MKKQTKEVYKKNRSTAWNRVFLEMLTVLQPIRMYTACYGTCRFITVFKRTCHFYAFNQTNLVHMFLSCLFEDPFLGTFAKL